MKPNTDNVNTDLIDIPDKDDDDKIRMTKKKVLMRTVLR